jgi:protein involved in ribonucleotide reduction
MKIVYVTVTGNCLYIAKRLGGELLSIPQLQKDGVFESIDDMVGIICPSYGFTMPHLAKQYLENRGMQLNVYAWLIDEKAGEKCLL